MQAERNVVQSVSRVSSSFALRCVPGHRIPWSTRCDSSVPTTRVTDVPFIDLNAIPAIEPVPGCRMRTPHGEHLMLSFLEMDAGAEVPLHHHPHEQGGILIRGRMQLTIGDETRTVDAGSMFLIPSNVPHRAIAIDGPAVVLDVFSPVREDYAELTNRWIPPVTGSATT